jgi:hypothetical protein
MSWEQTINPGSPVWTGVMGYADARIGELSAVCIEPTSTDAEIRAAQAGITELRRLKTVPDRLRTNDEMKRSGPTRREY